MNYNLSVFISENDLQNILATGQCVVLAKSVECAMSDMPVAWSVFRPFLNNQLSWNSEFQAFAADSRLMTGVVINPIYQADVGFGQNIPYTTQGFGTPKSGASPANSMAVTNQGNDQQITTGLSQRSNVNGMNMNASPICVLSLSKQLTATLTPLENVQVFLGSYMNNGTVLSQIPSNACSVSFGGGAYSRSIQYDGASGCFVEA